MATLELGPVVGSPLVTTGGMVLELGVCVAPVDDVVCVVVGPGALLDIVGLSVPEPESVGTGSWSTSESVPPLLHASDQTEHNPTKTSPRARMRGLYAAALGAQEPALEARRPCDATAEESTKNAN
jgi:hypothetical protein